MYCIYWYVPLHISMYQYIQVRTRTYAYIRVPDVSSLYKKGANRSRTCNLLHTVHREFPCVTGVLTSMQVIIKYDVSVYITCLKRTWRLMTNRRRWSRRAAAPSHDIPRPSLDSDADLRVTEAQPELCSGLGWNVRCAGGQKIESERDSDLTATNALEHS